jgi:GAF domain-containing protein
MEGIVTKTVTEATKMLNEGIPGHRILTYLIGAAERIAGDDSVSSILILDKNGLLRNGASPRLPYDYLTAIDGLKPNRNVGTCAAAAATGSVVITSDFRDDDKWAELRHLPLSLGFICAWSMPIKNENGKVLGTFGTYFRTKRKPTTAEIEAVESFALVAAKVLSAGN